jgi:hypothetical protein
VRTIVVVCGTCSEGVPHEVAASAGSVDNGGLGTDVVAGTALDPVCAGRAEWTDEHADPLITSAIASASPPVPVRFRMPHLTISIPI